MLALVVVLVAATPNDPAWPQQRPAFERIHLEEAWALETGDSPRIGVVDTGLVRAHSDFFDDGGWNFLAGADGDGAYDETGLGPLAHGSHVAGTLGARGDNGTGIAGVAWNASIISARALTTEGQGNNLTIMSAARWLAGLDVSDRVGGGQAPAIAPVGVINLSLGVPGGCDAQMQQDVDDILARGVVLVAASGNHGGVFGDAATDEVLAPAACDGVISVGAFDKDLRQTAYTNDRDGRVDVLGPGGEDGDPIFSYGREPDSVVGQQGTSMAAPHVSGVVALLRSLNPSLTPDDVREILTGLPAGDDGVPLLDARAALDTASARFPAPRCFEVCDGGGCSATGSAAGSVVALLLLLRRRRRR